MLLARCGCAVREVPVRPVYADEASGIRPWHAMTVLGILVRGRVRAERLRRRAGAPEAP
jgi:hypothetical protein